MSEPKVVAVNSGPRHEFSKPSRQSITLVEGLGVEGDAHAGATVQHLYYKTRDPNRPNLRQVHLLNAELFDIVAQEGFRVEPGDLGENITTRGLDLLHLPEGTELTLGQAKIRLTGRRNPCSQIDRFRPGLLAHLLDDSSAGPLLCGVMSVVIRGGEVRPGDSIRISAPEGPHGALTVPLRSGWQGIMGFPDARVRSRDRNKQTAGYTYRLLMSSPKIVVVARFEVPAESMPPRGPKHKI